MQYLTTILDAVGNTPLIRLQKLSAGLRCTVLLKLESLNPGGSIKDRIGLAMVEDAERRGLLRAGGTIVEPTSGNTGHGLAMVAAIKGYRMVFVMPDKVAPEKITLLKAYGAEVVVCPTNVEREDPQSYYSVSERLVREIPGAFQPNQYFNPTNPAAHYASTGPELWQQTEGQIDVLVAGVGTGGTISGTAGYLKERRPGLHVVGADPDGSIFSGPIKPYKVEGVGEDFWPGTFTRELVDRIVQVSDRDSFRTARRLAREEGILIGGSGGMALHAALTVAPECDEGTVMVVILPDTGRNYLSKFFSDEWMRENGFAERLGGARVREVLAAGHAHTPELVAVGGGQSVGDAIDLMQRYGISQLPVSEGTDAEPANLQGSVSERSLLDRLFRDPTVVDRPVREIMDAPFPHLAADSPVEDAFIPFLRGEAALLVVDGDAPLGVVTRADLLEYVAHRRRDGS